MLYHSLYNMKSVHLGIIHTQTDRSHQHATPNLKITQMKLIRKRLPTEYRNRINNTQARSEEEAPQIQKSLGEHNRGKKSNKQHEKTKTTNTREEQQQRGRNKATHTRSSTLPPPKESEALCGEADHDTSEKQTTNNRGERRRTLNEERQTVHCKLVRELRSN